MSSIVVQCCRLAFLLNVVVVTSFAHAVQTEPSAEKVLAKLTSAMRSQNYRGVFTYEHGGSLETLDVAHAVIEGVEFERYLQLNGPEESLSLSGRMSACETLGGRILSGAGLASSQGQALHFNDYYQLYFKGYDRVAGRSVAVVQLLPKDNMRYGMTIGVDVESGILLKAVIASRKKVLERMQFVAFELDPQWDDDDLHQLTNAPPVSGACASVEKAKAADIESDEHKAKGFWAPTWVPAGFTLASTHWTELDGLVCTYTDGLSSFSIFANPELVPDNKDVKRIPRGVAQRGSTLVMMELLRFPDSFLHVTLVGEIPESAARRILRSMGQPKKKSEPNTASK